MFTTMKRKLFIQRLSKPNSIIMSEFEHEFMTLTPAGIIDNITSTTEVDAFVVRAFIDLKAMRQEYDKVYVKLASWLLNDKLGEKVHVKLLYQKNDTSLAEIVTISSNGDAKWKKVGSEWIDLFEKVPEARLEDYGHFFQRVWVSGGIGHAHGVSVLIMGVRKTMPDVGIFMKGGIKALEEKIRGEISKIYELLVKRWEHLEELISIASEVSDGNLNRNWAVSAISLSLMENIVNLKLKALGEVIKGEFSDRVSRLKDVLVEKEGWRREEVDELNRNLREKHAGRSMVLHGGYDHITTDEQANKDCKFITDIMKKLFKRMYVIDWSEPEAPLTKNRVIVIGKEAYHMGEPYDSWVKGKGINIVRRPPSENYNKYLESIGVRCTHLSPTIY